MGVSVSEAQMTAAFSRSVRETVRERAGTRCELCGTTCHIGHYHHRRPRGMGGTRREESGQPSNCLLLHPRCHADVESSRERAISNGWLVSSFIEPAEVPVKLWHGLVYLKDDGSFVPA